MNTAVIDNPILTGLNEQQLEAVTATEGPILVLAGPGSGKTRVLTQRIGYLLSELKADPSEILAVTFTNKAAKEMRDRLERLVGYSARSLTVGTFHAVCARVLRRDGAPVGLGPDFVIYDDDDQVRLLRQAITDVGLDEKQYTPRSVQSRISLAKSKLLSPEEYGANPASYFDEIAARVYRRYQELLEWNQAADFDDLLMKPVRLWSSHPQILAAYQDRWRRVLVDEYQDTNHAQYRLVRLLTERRRNLFVVGDEDQGIYSWRAADITNILNFERDYPEARVILLEQNYRSSQSILDVATGVIADNRDRTPKTLWTDKAGGIPAHVREAYDEQDEAQYIAREVMRLRASHGYQYGDVAVMYRTNAQSRSIEETMVRFRIPYQLVGGPRFYARKEVRDVLAYLRLVRNPYDTASLKRIVDTTHSGRGVGKTTVSALESYAARSNLPLWESIVLAVAPDGAADPMLDCYRPGAERPKLAGRARSALAELVEVVGSLRAVLEDLPLPQMIDTLLNRTGYAAALNDGSPEGAGRLENVKELLTVAQEYTHLQPGEAVASFLEDVSLMSDLDTVESAQDAVTLITLHAAKGLEYKVVFIAGMEEGLLPHSRSIENPNPLGAKRDIEEECRLAYVGVTRAMERLYLSYAFHRTIFGSTRTNEPSRFLRGIPDSKVSGFLPPTVPRHKAAAPSPRDTQAVFEPIMTRVSARASEPAPEVDFAPGDNVRHPRFGEGTVTGIHTRGGDAEIEVRFAAGTTKRLLASLSNMEKV